MSPLKPNPAKVLLRNEISAKISALTTEDKKRQSAIVFNKLIKHPWYINSNKISLFMSTDDEIDTAPMIDHIKARGASAFVPQYAGGVMRMLRLEPGDVGNVGNMPITRHGIAQHKKGLVRDDSMDTGLDLIITPGVAFTKAGHRLGHGGGYYDKFLAKIRSESDPPKVIAIAFDCQVVNQVPVNELDQLVDDVLFAE